MKKIRRKFLDPNPLRCGECGKKMVWVSWDYGGQKMGCWECPDKHEGKTR